MSTGSHTKHLEQMNSTGPEMDNQMCHDDELMFDRGSGPCSVEDLTAEVDQWAVLKLPVTLRHWDTGITPICCVIVRTVDARVETASMWS